MSKQEPKSEDVSDSDWELVDVTDPSATQPSKLCIRSRGREPTGEVQGTSNSNIENRTGRLYSGAEFVELMKGKRAQTVGKQELVFWPFEPPVDPVHSTLHVLGLTKNLMYHGRHRGRRRATTKEYRDFAPGTQSEMKKKIVHYVHEGRKHEVASIYVKDQDIFFIPGVHDYATYMLLIHHTRWQYNEAEVMQHLLVPLKEVKQALEYLKRTERLKAKNFWAVFPVDPPSERYKYSILVDNCDAAMQELEKTFWIDSIADPLVKKVDENSPGLEDTQKESIRAVASDLNSFGDDNHKVITEWEFVTWNKVDKPFPRFVKTY